MLIIPLNYSGKRMVRLRFRVNFIKAIINLITSRLIFSDIRGTVGYADFEVCDKIELQEDEYATFTFCNAS